MYKLNFKSIVLLVLLSIIKNGQAQDPFSAIMEPRESPCRARPIDSLALSNVFGFKYYKSKVDDLISNIGKKTRKNADSTYVIPVIFHVMHTYGFENIESELLYEALEELNMRFNLRNIDTAEIAPPFKEIVGNPKIEFRLATIDPWGNCTNGINRVFNTHSFGFSITKFNRRTTNDSIFYWDREKYLNIWVLRYLEKASGSAAFPGQSDNIYDGIFLFAPTLWRRNVDGKTTLSHEVGHWFNLSHIWGNTNDPNPANGCEIDDFVSDTPLQEAANYRCPDFPQENCENGPIGENYHNYMDYTSCRNMFTIGQVHRMYDALNNPAEGFRHKIWQQSNLGVTGTNFDTYEFDCPSPPNISFSFEERDTAWILPCNPIQLKGLYSKSKPTNWEWTFEGGTPANSNEQNPLVSWERTGTYKITLIGSNVYGSDTLIVDKKIFVLPGSDFYGSNLSEGFERSRVGEDIFEWSYSQNSQNWRISSLSASEGRSSIKRVTSQVAGYGDHLDFLHLPPMNVEGLGKMKLKFSIALARKKTDINGSFTVIASESCNVLDTTFQTIFRSDELIELVTVEDIPPGNFIPHSTEWKEYEIELPVEFKDAKKLFLAFTLRNDDGSDFYLDDIRLEPVISTSKDTDLNKLLKLFPNPVNNLLKISCNYSLLALNTARYKIVDKLGRTIQKGAISSSDMEINLNQVCPGIYFVQVSSELGSYAEKIVKN